MPLAQEFTEYERGYIDAARKAGKSFKSIAEELNRSESGVRSAAYRKEHKKRSGRPQKLSMKDQINVLKKASDSTKSARDIKNECSLDVSTRTISRIISKAHRTKKVKAKKPPKPVLVHKETKPELSRNNAKRN